MAAKKVKRVLTQQDKMVIGDYYIALNKNIKPKERKQKTAKKFKIGESTADVISRKRALELGVDLPGSKAVLTNEQKLEAVKQVIAGGSLNAVRAKFNMGYITLKNLVNDSKTLEAKNKKTTVGIITPSKPKPKPKPPFPSIDYDSDSDEVKSLKEDNLKLKIKNSALKERCTYLRKICIGLLDDF